MARSNLHTAKQQKNDEFYTQLADIENELRHYKEQFYGKVVFCNCDDPYESNFFKYFANNFNHLGLKKLIATSYNNSPIAGIDLPLFQIAGAGGKQPIKIEITEVPDVDGDGAMGLSDVKYLLQHDANTSAPLMSTGDFRSDECVELLKQADIVVTNPPFSLFREYVAQLVEYDKKFLIVGSKNSITYKEIFKLIIENKVWLGYGFSGGNAYFRTPNAREFASGVYDPKTGLVKFRNVGWFTNMDFDERHEDIVLYKKFTQDTYPKYDNYDAINVDKTADIPLDYSGAMGVPITFLDRFSPDQFEILGITSGRDEFEAKPTKRYINPKQINKDGSITNGSKANTRATLLWKNKSGEIHYTADNADGYLSILYARIVIRNKKVKESI